MPELRRDPVVGRWVIISTERARRPSDFPADALAAEGRPVRLLCGAGVANARRGVGAPTRREPTEPAGLARSRRAQQVPGAADRGRARAVRRGALRPDERGRRPRGRHRGARARCRHRAPGHGASRGGAARLSGADPRPREGPPPRVRDGLQEPRRPGRRLARAHPLSAHRDAHRAEHGGGGAGGRPPALPDQAALHLVRHRPPGAP